VTLVDCVVLAVDRQDGDIALTGSGGEDFSRSDHALLIGQADRSSSEDGGVSGLKPGNADDGGDDEIRFREGGAGDCALGAVDDFDAGDAGILEPLLQGFGKFFGGERDEVGTPADGLREGFVEVASRGK